MNRLETLETLVRFICPPKLKLVEFDLGEMLEELRMRFGNDRIQVELSVDYQLPPVRGDREVLQEAFANVMINAVEAMPDGGILSVAPTREDLAVVVNVTDSGRGSHRKIRREFSNCTIRPKPVV